MIDEQAMAEAQRLVDFHSTGLPGTSQDIADLAAELIKDVRQQAPRAEVMGDIEALLNRVAGGSAEKVLRPLFDGLKAEQ